ncbi:hypothetical protein BFG05_01325 [Campylobacter pinnipediorum subsp. pinnipediorum]|uniref:HMA2 domain-containing protein n=1 Tax=Campylobacter pinnipediorum TaxID=1965231 RepID=UPI00099526F0|nr:hypothetical protein [Campylobacter pinnipediorum]OPA79772.1 hypothetical protein BFG05_01325 [Campylobacter pinnipediorum subsp. pinnipediorum]
MDINTQDILKVVSYFKPISHTPGRLRVRVNPKIKELSNEIDVSSLDSMINKINGINNVKINKIIGSVTIEYDKMVFDKQIWDDLLSGNNIENISEKINNIAKEVYAG